MILSETNEKKWRKICEKAHLNDDTKFKPKKFKRPPKYLRLDQPKNKWIVKPTRLDLLKDADAVLESLIENRVPRTRRFQQRRRRRKKKKVIRKHNPKPPSDNNNNNNNTNHNKQKQKLHNPKPKKSIKVRFIRDKQKEREMANQITWSSKNTMEKYANDGYNMKEQFRKNISTLHNGEIDPNIKKYFERKRRRERERAQKKALANALNDGNANDDDEEEYSESYYGDEENPHGSSSDEDDFSNLDQNNVYHRLKFKLEQYKLNSDLTLHLNAKVQRYKDKRLEELRKKAGGRNYIKEHKAGKHLNEVKNLKKIQRQKKMKREKKGNEVRTAKEILLKKEHDVSLKNASKHEMRMKELERKKDFETFFTKKWLTIISNNNYLLKMKSILPSSPQSRVVKYSSPVGSSAGETPQRRRRKNKDENDDMDKFEEAEQAKVQMKLKKHALTIIRFLKLRVNQKKGKKLLKAYTVLHRTMRRFVFLVRFKKQRIAIDLIKRFIEEQSSNALSQVMKRYRYNVIKCQRFYRTYRNCKHSRIIALSLWWSRLEGEYGRYIKDKKEKELKGNIATLKSKGAEEGLDRLSIHQRVLKRNRDGIQEDPGDIYLGEESAAHLDYHLLKGLENIIDKAAPKNNEPVTFNIRFEMLHRFLTRLRRKHNQKVHEFKKELAFRRTIVTVEDLKKAMRPNISITDAINLREEPPLPTFTVYSNISHKQMFNLVKEGHRYEKKFEKLEGGFQNTLHPLPFVKLFFKERSKDKRR